MHRPLQSPIAYTPDAVVSILSPVTIPAGPTSIPASAQPSGITGRRPVAITTISVVSASDPRLVSNVTLKLPSGDLDTDATFAPVTMSIPAFCPMMLRSRLEMSLSKAGNISLQYSSTLTLVPNAAMMHASSIPITPPPMITALPGNDSADNTSSLVTVYSAPSMRGIAGLEPVAIIILPAVYTLSPAATIPGATKEASALMTSTPLRAAATPSRSVATVLRILDTARP